MPASLVTEEALAEALLKKVNYTATVAYLGVATTATVEKKTTAKAFGEAEPKESQEWARQQIDTIEWEVVKGEDATTPTKYRNKNAITFHVINAGEYKLESVAVLTKAKQSEDEASSKGILLFGKLTTPVTINSATTEIKFAAKELVIEFT